MIRRFDRVSSIAKLGLALAACVGATMALASEQMRFIGHAVSEDLEGREEPRLLVTSDDGDSWLLDVGPGCDGLREGERIGLERDAAASRSSIHSLEPESTSGCPVHEMRAVQLLDAPPASVATPLADSATASELARVVEAIQSGLAVLGYRPGALDGRLGPETASALMRYRADKQHDERGQDLRFTLWTLAMDVLVERPRDAGALAIADVLFGAARE